MNCCSCSRTFCRRTAIRQQCWALIGMTYFAMSLHLRIRFAQSYQLQSGLVRPDHLHSGP